MGWAMTIALVLALGLQCTYAGSLSACCDTIVHVLLTDRRALDYTGNRLGGPAVVPAFVGSAANSNGNNLVKPASIPAGAGGDAFSHLAVSHLIPTAFETHLATLAPTSMAQATPNPIPLVKSAFIQPPQSSLARTPRYTPQAAAPSAPTLQASPKIAVVQSLQVKPANPSPPSFSPIPQPQNQQGSPYGTLAIVEAATVASVETTNGIKTTVHITYTTTISVVYVSRTSSFAASGLGSMSTSSPAITPTGGPMAFNGTGAYQNVSSDPFAGSTLTVVTSSGRLFLAFARVQQTAASLDVPTPSSTPVSYLAPASTGGTSPYGGQPAAGGNSSPPTGQVGGNTVGQDAGQGASGQGGIYADSGQGGGQASSSYPNQGTSSLFESGGSTGAQGASSNTNGNNLPNSPGNGYAGSGGATDASSNVGGLVAAFASEIAHQDQADGTSGQSNQNFGGAGSSNTGQGSTQNGQAYGQSSGQASGESYGATNGPINGQSNSPLSGQSGSQTNGASNDQWNSQSSNQANGQSNGQWGGQSSAQPSSQSAYTLQNGQSNAPSNGQPGFDSSPNWQGSTATTSVLTPTGPIPVLISGTPIVPGAPPITVGGMRLSLSSSGQTLYINTRTYAVPQPYMMRTNVNGQGNSAIALSIGSNGGPVLSYGSAYPGNQAGSGNGETTTLTTYAFSTQYVVPTQSAGDGTSDGSMGSVLTQASSSQSMRIGNAVSSWLTTTLFASVSAILFTAAVL